MSLSLDTQSVSDAKRTTGSLSPKQQFLSLPTSKQTDYINSLTEEEAAAILSSWWWTARPEQLEPEGDWFCWLVLAGRGWGKTRTASEWIIEQVTTNRSRRIALIGRTAADVRDIQIEGVSGILSVARERGIQAHYEPSKRRITFENGAVAIAYSAEEPNLLRGPEHDAGWIDELASHAVPRNSENDAYSNFIMGLRLGEHPRFIVTTTPRPTRVIKALVADPSTHVTKGSTYDNIDNLSPKFIEEVKRRYEGTRIGKQELYGEVLDDVEGALWQFDQIADARVEQAPPLKRIVVAVDPSTTTNEKSDFTGITVSGVDILNDYYVLHAEQVKLSPHGWATRVLELFDHFEADRIIAERNQGGQMVEHTIRTVRKNAPITTIHASRGKQTRAEPVAALYEQGKVHHVGIHEDLEDQMIVFPVVTDVHDDLVDSLVYSLTELAGLTDSKPSTGQLITYSRAGRRAGRR